MPDTNVNIDNLRTSRELNCVVGSISGIYAGIHIVGEFCLAAQGKLDNPAAKLAYITTLGLLTLGFGVAAAYQHGQVRAIERSNSIGSDASSEPEPQPQ